MRYRCNRRDWSRQEDLITPDEGVTRTAAETSRRAPGLPRTDVMKGLYHVLSTLEGGLGLLLGCSDVTDAISIIGLAKRISPDEGVTKLRQLKEWV